MLYALRNKATGLLMADKYRAQTTNLDEAVLHTSAKNAGLSVKRRKRIAKEFNIKWPSQALPTDFAVVPVELTEVLT